MSVRSFVCAQSSWCHLSRQGTLERKGDQFQKIISCNPTAAACYSIVTRYDKIRYDADSNFLNCMLLLVCCVICDTFITSIFYMNL